MNTPHDSRIPFDVDNWKAGIYGVGQHKFRVIAER